MNGHFNRHTQMTTQLGPSVRVPSPQGVVQVLARLMELLAQSFGGRFARLRKANWQQAEEFLLSSSLSERKCLSRFSRLFGA